MTTRTFALLSTALATLAAPAFAQQSAAAADGGIEEIVVTASKRSENLQDVSAAVTAVTGEALKDQNITDATRLELVTPGLTIGRSGSDLRPAIRGVRTENVGANADPTIGFFIDGVYQSRTTQALAAFVDLERVEVLRGPQGTLYGRNTFGGAINLVSAKPSTDGISGSIDLLYGRFDRIREEGHVNLPIGETAAFRLAGMFEKADGFVKNIGAGNDLGDENQYYIRPSLRLLPSENLTIDLMGQYWKQKGAGLSAFGYKSKGTLVDTAFLSATNSGRSLTGRPVDINTRVRDGVADINGFDIGVPILDTYTVNFDGRARRDNELKGITASIDYDAGFATFRSITGYTDFYSYRQIDNDFTQFPIALDYNVTDVETFSQEIQLASKAGSAFDWIIGAFYFDDQVEETFFNDQDNSYPAAGSAAASGPPFQAGAPNGGVFALTRADSVTPVSVGTKSYAGFAQLGYNVTEQLKIVGGIRYTEDRKTYSRRFLSGPGLTLASGPTAPLTQSGQKATFDKVTWKLGVDFKATEDNLLYANVSTGFTSGGFNGGTFTPAGSTTPLALPPFNPQTVRAYELGSKNRTADGTLQINAALFYNDFKGLQVQSQVPFAGTVISTTGNAGKGRAYGAELETIYKPTDALTMGLNATLLNAKYDTLFLNNPFPNPVQACSAATGAGASIALPVGSLRCLNTGPGVFINQVDLAGARIPFSPEFTSTIWARYDIETSAGTFTPQINFFYNSGYFNTDFNTALDKQGSYTKTDLRISWVSTGGRYTAQVYVENLEDEAVNQRGVFGANQSLNANYAPPRTYGARFGVRF